MKLPKTGFLKINGVTLPDPTEYSYGLQDISKSDAGRDESTEMHPGKIGRVRTHSLGWSNIDPQETSEILTAVKPETFNATLWDMQNGQYETRTYYVGDRSSMVYMWADGRKIVGKVSFQIIETKAHDD